MALLKKIKSATLIESLVATVLIVIIFIVSSLILNNLLINSFSNNTHPIEQRIDEINYQIFHNKLKVPYNETHDKWSIDIKFQTIDNKKWLTISALHVENKKEVNRRILYGR